MQLRVWKLNDQAARIEPADKTLLGTAHPEALKWCGPYIHANQLGFWLFPPVDLDFIWRGENKFEHQMLPWNNDEVSLVQNLVKESDSEDNKSFLNTFGGRVKVDFGRVEPNICQIWTGLIFQTPPGWGLHIRSPINIAMNTPYRIQEGILETSWLRYDIWINLAVQIPNTVISLRRNQPLPLAQLIPVKREAYEKWELRQELINRNDEEGDKAFCEWAQYNFQKYTKKKDKIHKDPSTYHRERHRQSPKVSPSGDEK